jgi:hypothetical protein
MENALTIALYCAMGILLVILAMGIINLMRTDPDQPSRSNKLMRLRVLVQFVAVLILIGLGLVSGMLKF